MGGLHRGGFVYEHATGERVYLHVDDAGDVDIAGWDATQERHSPDREALEVIAANDLRRLRESGRPEDLALLLVAGFDEFRTVRSYRGRRKRWDSTKLERLLQDVEREGFTPRRNNGVSARVECVNSGVRPKTPDESAAKGAPARRASNPTGIERRG